MHSRCYKPSDISWKNYGGRGIAVCERWHGDDGFNCFLEDVGCRPSIAHSLDRIDNDGDYEPGNVRWATQRQQMRNLRTNRKITFRGETKTLTDWAMTLGCSKEALWMRLDKYKWPIAKALTTPFIHYRRGVTFKGTTATAVEWGRRTGIPHEAIRGRLKRGWSVEDALTKPYQEAKARRPA